MGCLAAPNHCCGQDTPAIGTWHQHSPARALFAGSRTTITPHHHPTVPQPANAKEATALARLLHVCVAVAGPLAQLWRAFAGSLCAYSISAPSFDCGGSPKPSIRQNYSLTGLLGEPPPPLARLRTLLIGVLDIGAAARAKAGCAGGLSAPPYTTRSQ